jgi:hypothetical protein
VQAGADALAQSFQGKVPVTSLGALVDGDDADYGTELVQKARPLVLRKGTRLLDVPGQGHLGVGGVRVLTAGATAAGKSPAKFASRDREPAGDV